MKELFHKYKEVISYLVFGVATTIVNIVIFFVCKDILGIDYKVSNAIGWFLSVLFAFFTNKYFVLLVIMRISVLLSKKCFYFTGIEFCHLS